VPRAQHPLRHAAQGARPSSQNYYTPGTPRRPLPVSVPVRPRVVQRQGATFARSFASKSAT
jgi:hypothetical protein